MLASAHFFSTLSGGSQAHKTDLDKELVMICVERNGLEDPYLLLTLNIPILKSGAMQVVLSINLINLVE